ncbi:MAG TPA: glycosyl hydrolase family 28-related protein [Acidobacteriaceae bacterium]|nr:glycosyl hydrolase family 28-related protein [Acidobacteriaceae bacterium]
MRLRPLLPLLLAFTLSPLRAQSVYTQRPDDPHAVYCGPGSFGAHADGVADDTDALQAAINQVQETTGQGVVFLAEGRYRITRTITLWQGIRVIGYGAHRPVLVLTPHASGFGEGHGYLGTGRYMLQFAEKRPSPGQPFVDANEFTFYSALSNLDFEIGAGNPGAIAVRFHVAQHSFLSHMHFSVGEGRAALEDVGNQASDLVIEGGEYGIITKRTGPAWQFLLMDSRLTGQRTAAIHTEEAGMTLIRDEITHTPVAVEISHGMPEQLYARDLLLSDIGQAAFVTGDVLNQHHQVTLENIQCAHVKQLLAEGEQAQGWTPITAPAPFFVEEKLTLGQEIDAHGREGTIALRHHERNLSTTPKPMPSDIPALPPMREWANVHALGVTGDGGTDDTPALQKAIDTHRVLYFPEGVYRLRNSLRLRPDTVLIGFSPVATQLTLWDEDPAFTGQGNAVPLVITPKGGTNILSGLGISAGDAAPQAAGVLWQSGATSFMDDVNFPRGRGHLVPSLAPKMQQPPSSARTQDNRNTQFPSLWVRDGGGGIFRDIWTPDTMARAGLRVENTDTPSVVYQLSCEHHMANEVQFLHASHWRVYALQTEEEKPDGAEAVALELDHAHDITFANQTEYRVSRNVMPKLAGTVARGSSDIRWENLHNFSMTRLAFDNSILDETSGVAVRTHDFTNFKLDAATKPGPPLPLSNAFAQGAALRKLAGDFSNASGLTVDEGGVLYFTDSANHRVYRWNAAAKRAEVLTEGIDAPQSAGFAAPNHLLVVDNSKAVYAIALDGTAAVQKLTPEPAPRPGTRFLLPVGLHEETVWLQRTVEHIGFVFSGRSNMATSALVPDEPRGFFYAPGSNIAMVGGGTWKPLLQSSQEASIAVGETHLAVSETDDKVDRITLSAPDKLAFAPWIPRSGTSVVTDAAGNVYVAGAQVFVYNREGRPDGVLEIPERPSSLAVGGPDHRTLFIGARSSLYSIELRAPGPSALR